MTVEADKAIGFECESCGEYNYHENSLEPGWYQQRAVNEDHVTCDQCGYDNHIIEEL